MTSPATVETITLAGGCFWCVEAVFELVKGVQSVESGYSNGHVTQPSYEQVCEGRTGHAEVVQVHFDPAVVSLRQLLEVFFTVHDPTTLNRQGNDVGTQYRSAVYWSDPGHEATVREVTAEVDAALDGRVVTELAPLANYSAAEAYHQHYFAQHPQQGYCAYVVAPKVDKFQRTFAQLVKA